MLGQCLCRSKIFPGSIGEIHAVIPSGTPLIATATPAIQHDIITKVEMSESEFVHVTPNCPNIYSEHLSTWLKHREFWCTAIL